MQNQIAGVMIFQLLPNVAAPALMLTFNESAPSFAAMHYIGATLTILGCAVLSHQIMSPLIKKMEDLKKETQKVRTSKKDEEALAATPIQISINRMR
jgi:hypothetical protein